ncbi:MAG: FHA domain-containing protein [Deltaproteobacteria bacterium]|nr:FHA domain-containing protein [Deltaproteobacteria bacterium]
MTRIDRTLRLLASPLLVLCALLTAPGVARAAPEAKILRIDPRASRESGDPVITMVVEVAQSRRVSEATAPCAAFTGDAQLGCIADAMEKPGALYEPFPFPEKNAIFTVTVDGTDRPAKLLSHTKWGEASRDPAVGTAWLVLIDADKRMDRAFGDAKQVAEQFVAALGPNDIVNVMFFNDRQVVADSKWLPAARKAKAQSFIDSVPATYPNQGRNRSLLSVIKSAATDGFKGLGNSGESVKIPLHQAMVVLSNGYGGTDPSTSGPGAMQLQQYMTGGRFPEDNTALPKSPVPVISVYFPLKTLEEFRQNSLEFMQNLANPEIGGFFTIVQPGAGGRAAGIVKAVRTRFSKTYLAKWRVSCIAPTVTQSFKLVFNNVNPPILGDNSFKDVPVGIDPSTWPLDVNVQYTKETVAKAGGVHPGGRFRVFGDFCWGGAAERAEVYFLPAGQAPPTDLAGGDIEKAKRTQQQLIGMGMRGKAIEATDTFVELEAPDKDKLIHGSGEQGIARVILYDNKAHRTSGLTADTMLEVKAAPAPLPILWILGGAFALVVVALLLVLVLRSGGKKRGGAPPPAPVVAGRPQTGFGAAGPGATAPAYGSRAVLSGAAGTFTVAPGPEQRLGRDPSQCAIALSDARVSSVHATLKVEGGQLFVRDEGSTHGTFVDGVQIQPGSWVLIRHGGTLRLGPVELAARLE